MAMFAYDVWWVFLQPLVTDSESVMITVRSVTRLPFAAAMARSPSAVLLSCVSLVQVATGGRSGIPIPMLFKVPGWHFAETGAYSMMGCAR